MTFRRTSTTPQGSSSHVPPPPSDAATASLTDIQSASHYDLSSARYTKDDLLQAYSQQKSADPSRLFLPGWDPSNINGAGGRGWGKSNENHVPQEPGACWDQNGESTPLGLQNLSAEEKEVSNPIPILKQSVPIFFKLSISTRSAVPTTSN